MDGPGATIAASDNAAPRKPGKRIDPAGRVTAQALVWTRHLAQLWTVVEASYRYEDEQLAENIVRVLLTTGDNRLFVENWGFSEEFDQMVRTILAEQVQAEPSE